MGISEPTSQRFVVFTHKTIGKKVKRVAPIARFYYSIPLSSREKPVFEARVKRDEVIAFVVRLNTPYKLEERVMVIEGNDVDNVFRRLIIYAGIRQFVSEEGVSEVLETVLSMGEVESLYWFTRFTEFYRRGGYWYVCRVSKAIRILYRL